MRKLLYQALSLLVCGCFLMFGNSAYASHLLGGDLTYTHVSGMTYKITLTLFGDCSSTTGAFPTLQISRPQICIFDGSINVSTISLGLPVVTCGTEITPLCTGLVSNCTDPSSVIPGIQKFTYSANYTLPHTSTHWRFIYTGNNGSTSGALSCGFSGISAPSSAGRTAAITNLASSSTLQLIDTLNNSSFSDNNSSTFNTYPAPYYDINQYQAYDPAATDVDGDSLTFSLITAGNGSSSCSLGGAGVTYVGTAWPGTPISGTTPLQVLAGSFSLNYSTGALTFYPNMYQRSIVVYNVREFRGGIFVGNCQREITISVEPPSPSAPCTGMPVAGSVSEYFDCTTYRYVLSLSDYSCAGVSFQWQWSSDSSMWHDVAGATLSTISITPTSGHYYRCAVKCISSGYIAYTGPVYIPATHSGLHSTIIYNPDTTCNAVKFHISTCISSPSYRVATFYGDGLSDTANLTTTAPYYADVLHYYSAPGTYRIKHILLESGSPVDSNSFNYEYLFCNFLPFKIYYDINNNCEFDMGDLFLQHPIKVAIDSNGIAVDTISSFSGFYYKTYGAPGSVYGFRVLPNPGEPIFCPLSGTIYDTILPLVNNYPVKYFGVGCSGSAFDLRTKPFFIAGRHAAQATMIVDNLHCTPAVTTASLTFSPNYEFQMATPTPATVLGNTVTWDLGILSSFSGTTVIKLYLERSGPSLPIGDTVNSSYSVFPTTGDSDVSNNCVVRCDTIKGSYDPNLIEVTPKGYISSGTQLEYSINFENTGNDTAFDIHVMDTLSSFVDIRSLEVVAASAVMNVAAYSEGPYNIVKFDFPNINLLDSSHHGGCDGLVVFKVNTLNGLPSGTEILNRAGIYFDYNEPVLTNTVEDIIGIPILDINNRVQQKVDIYPNPASDRLTIICGGTFNSYTINNTVGQLMTGGSIVAGRSTVNIKDLPAGLYVITLKGDNGSYVQKFVKM